MKNIVISAFSKSVVAGSLFLLLQLFSGKAHAQSLVISQIYGAGGNSGATYQNDFVELFNPTGSTINITNWSIQYASTSGSSWGVTTIASASIPSGKYYLIKLASGGAVGSVLPTADLTGTTDMAAANGKVALCSSTTALTVSDPCRPNNGTVVDYVGYGTANAFEGIAAAPAISTTTSASRAGSGCQDFNSNNLDFTAGTITPRNSSTAANVCSYTNYYSKATGNLDAVGTWGVNTDGSGASPSNFTTAQQIFHVANSNPATAWTGSTWTVSGVSSKIVLDASTNLTVGPSITISGKIDVGSGTTLTLSNSIFPTLSNLDPAGTVVFNSLSFNSSTLIPVYRIYGNITLNNTPVTLPTGSLDIIFKGNFTLSGSSSFAGGDSTTSTNGYNIVAAGSTAQTISANGNLFYARNLDINNTLGSKSGTVALASNTNILLSNSTRVNVTGSGNQFSDGGNTIKVFNNPSMGGDAAGYNFTGTLYCAATAAGGATVIRGYTAGGAVSTVVAAPTFNNIVINNATTLSVSFGPTGGGATVNIAGNLVIASSGTGATTLNANTINIGGNFSHSSSTNTFTPTAGSTVVFNGSSPQTYSTNVVSGHTFANLKINNSNGLTLSNRNINVSGNLNLTSGKIITGSNTVSLTAGTATVSNAGSSSYVNGNLQKVVAVGTTTTVFEVGNSTAYAPIKLTFGSSITGGTGSITVKSTSGSHGSIASSSINTAHYLPSYWTITATSMTPAASTVAADLSYASPDITGGACNSSFIVNRFASSAWTLPTVANSTSGVSPLLAYVTTGSTLTLGGLTGDYAVGSRKAVIAGSSSVYVGISTTFTGTPASGTWGTSDPAVATVTAGGVVTGTGIGTAVISYSVTNSCSITSIATLNVTVASVPTITLVSPYTVIPGNTVSITGTNFNANLNKNLIYFGATRVTPSSGSTTTLSATVPVGALLGPVSVTDTAAGEIAYSPRFAMPVFDTTGLRTDTLNFKPRVDFANGIASSTPYSGAIGDIDGDGKPDLVVNNVNNSSVTVFINNSVTGSISSSSFTLSASISITLEGKPNNVKLADLNGDGKLDIIAALTNSNNLQVIRNTTTVAGTPTFAGRQAFAAGFTGAVVAAADFDGDGKTDVALTLPTGGAGLGGIAIFKNTSTTTSINFATATSLSILSGGFVPSGIIAADLDGDGLPDLATSVSGFNGTSYTGTTVSMFRNTSSIGAISFGTEASLTTATGPIDIAAGDIDGDNKLDLVVTNNASNSFSAFRNISSSGSLITSSFGTKVDFTTGTGTTGIALADLNGDRKLEVVTSNATANTLSLFRNTTVSSGTFSSSTFATKVDYATGSLPTTVTIGDIDGDKYPDIVNGNAGATTVSILRNYPLPQVSPITGTAIACANGTITLSDATTGGTWISVRPSVATVSTLTGTTGSVSPFASSVADTVTIQYRVIAGGDTNYASAVVTINPQPSGISASGTPNPVCTGSSLTINGSATGATTYSWSGPDTYTSTDLHPAAFTSSTLSAGIYTLTATTANGCFSTAVTSPVTVSTPATSVVAIATPTTLCTGDNITLTSSDIGGTSYSWSGPGGFSSINPNPPAFAATASGIYSLTVFSGACSVNTVTATVTVNAPTPTISGTTTILIGSGTTLTFSGAAGDVVNYSWTGGSSASTTLDGGGTSIVSVTPTSTTTYSITSATSSGGCFATITGQSAIVTIDLGCTVAPTSVSANLSSPSVCTGGTVTVTGAATNATSYSWSGPNSFTSLVLNPAGFTVSALSAGIYTLTATNACGSTTATTASLTIETAPTGVSATPSATIVCDGSTLTLTGAATDATSYSWSGPNSFSSTDQNPIGFAVNTSSAGIYTLTATNVCGSTSATTSSISINSVPTGVSATPSSTSICSGASLTLTGAATNATSYSWSGPNSFSSTDQNPAAFAVSALSAGIYTLTATNTCGNTTATTSSISVIDVPTGVAATPSSASICNGTTLTLTGSSTGATSYSWSGPNSFSSALNPASLTVGTASAGIYTVTAINSCGNATATTTSITISPLPSGVSATPSSATLCSGSTLTLTGAAMDATSYLWSGPNSFTSTILNPAAFTVGTASTGIYTLSAINSCATITATTSAIAVNPLPTATVSGTTSIVTGNSTTIVFTGTSSAVVYYWDGGSTLNTTLSAGGTSTVTVSPTVTTTYSVSSATSAAGCSQSLSGSTAVITVTPAPVVIYSIAFSATTATASDAPATLDAHLTTPTPAWTTSSTFSSLAGATGQALSLANSSGTPTYTLTFNVASGYALNVSSFNFWRQRSNTGAQNWSLAVNSTNIGSGTVPTTGAALGSTTVSTPISNLTGTVTVVLTLSGASGTGTFRLDDFSLSGSLVALPVYNYYSKSSGNLNTAATWGTNTDGTGTAPSDFVSNYQTFHIANSNPSSFTGSSWIVSGIGSKVVLDAATDLVIPNTTTLTGTVDIGTGRTLTLSNPTFPTFGTMITTGTTTSMSTIVYNGLTFTSSFLVPTSITYGNVVFNNTSVALPAAAQNLTFNGNFTLSGTSPFIGGDSTNTTPGYNFITNGTADQTVSGNNNTFYVRNFDINNTSGSKSGKVTLSSGTPMHVCNSTRMNITGTANQFSDGGNMIKVVNNPSMGGTADGYNFTGTLYMSATASGGSANLRGYTGGAAASTVPAVPAFNNIIVNNLSTQSVSFAPSTGGATYTIKGNLIIASTGTGATILNPNTINIGGDFTHVSATNTMTPGTSTVVFNGTGNQNYISNVTGGNTFNNLTINNGNTLTLSTGNLSVSGTLALTSGKVVTGANILSLTATATLTGGSSSSYVNGNFSKTMPAAGTTSMAYQIGDATYSPVRLTFSSSLTSGSILVKSTTGSHPLIASSYIDASNAVNRYWTITPTGITLPTTINIDLSYNSGDITGGGTNSAFILRQYSGSVWSTPTTLSNSTSGSAPLLANVTTTTGLSGSAFSGDFIAGNGLCSTPVAGTTVAAPTTLCSAGSTTLSLSGATSNAAIAYQWKSSATGSVYSDISGATSSTYTDAISATTYYKCNVSCLLTGSSDLSIPATVTVSGSPTSVSANAPSTVCNGASLTLTASATGATSYSWSGPDGFTSTDQNPAGFTAGALSTGVYSLTATNSCGSATATTTSVTLTDVPTSVSASASPTTLCDGSTLTLTGSATSATGYSWSGPGSFSSTDQNPAAFSVSTASAGVYTLSASNSCGNATATTSSVTINPSPSPIISGSATISLGYTATLTISGTAADVVNYSWTGGGSATVTLDGTGTSVFTVSPSSTTVYSITTATSALGCNGTITGAYATVTVDLGCTAAPTSVSAGLSPTPVCTGNTVTLTGNATDALTYSWSGPNSFTSTDQNPAPITIGTASAGGIYTLTATNACGSTTATTATLVINSTPTIVSATPSATTLCSGATLTLTGAATSAVSYSWSGPNSFTSTDLNPASFAVGTVSAGVYTLTATNSCGNTLATTAAITVNDVPTGVSATPSSTTVCNGASLTLIGAATVATSYSWSGPNSFTSTDLSPAAFAVSTLSAGVYSLTATNACGNTTANTASIVINDVPSGVGATPSSASICSGSTLTLTGAATGATSYSWDGPNSFSSAFNPATRTTNALSAGIYTVTATNSCGSATATTTSITINSLPTASIAGTASITSGSSTTLTFSGTASAVVYYWNGSTTTTTTLNGSGSSTVTVSPTVTTTYTLTSVTSVAGCSQVVSGSATITVTALTPVVIYLNNFGATTATASDAPTTLDAHLTTPTPAWTTSSTFTTFAGATGQALSLANSSGTPTYTLTLNVTSGYSLSMTSFSFWRQRSTTGAQNWAMTVNGTSVGSGTVPTAGANTGSTTVSTPITGLTGTVTVVLTMSGASGTGTFRLDDFSLTGNITAIPVNHYYSKSSGNLNSTTTWGLNTDGTGTAPSNFTTGSQIFHVANSNPGTFTGSSWTVSGSASKIALDAATDLVIPNTTTLTGTIDVAAGRMLTIANTVFPTLGTIDATSTVKFSSIAVPAAAATATSIYGSVILDNASFTNPGASTTMNFAGNFTIQNGASISCSNLTLATAGSADQVINGNGLTFGIRNLDNATANPTKTGKLLLRQNTPMTVLNSLIMTNTGAANAFSDSANTITVVNNITLGGNAAGYNLTGTIYITAPSGTTNVRGIAANTIPVAQFNNFTINSSGNVAFNSTNTANTITIKKDLLVLAAGTSITLGNGNTIQIGGNFSYSPTTEKIQSGTTTTLTTPAIVEFNGTSGQTYSSGITAGNTLNIVKVNNSSTGLTLSSPLNVTGSLLLTSGKVINGSNTLSLGAAATLTGGSASSYVSGNFSKTMPAAGTTSMVYEVGDVTYAPVKLTFSSSVTSGSVLVKATTGAHASIATSFIDASNAVNRYWTITPTGVSPTTINIDLSYNSGDITGGGSNSAFVLRKYNGSVWSTSPSITNSTSGSAPLLANVTTTTGTSGSSYSGDYIAGNGICSTPTAGTAIAAPTTLCSSGSTTLSLTGASSNAAITYQWKSSPDGSTYNDIIGATSAVYTTSLSVTTFYKCNVGCAITGNTALSTGVTVTISGSPTSVSANAPSTVCNGTSLTLTASATGATSYSWSGPNSFTSTDQNPAAFTAGTLSAGIYSLTATNSCGSATATSTSVSVIDVPTSVSASVTPTTLCSGATLTLTGSATSATSYSWSNSGGYTSTDLNPIAFTATGASAGIYTLTATNACGSTTATTSTVTINPAPAPIISGSATISLGATATLTITGTAGDIVDYSWTGGGSATVTLDGTGTSVFTVSPSSTTTYSLSSATSSLGCFAIITGTSAIVTVDLGCTGAPTSVSANLSSSTVCSGGVVTLTGAATNALSYSWSGPNSFTSTDLNPAGITTSPLSAGVYTLVATNPCGSTTVTTASLAVNTTPAGVSATPSATTLCAGASLTLTGAATGATSYSWSGPNSFSSTDQNPAPITTTIASAGIYSLTAGNSCGNTIVYSALVNINDVPSGISATPSSATVCSGTTLTLTGSASGATSYVWDGPDGFHSASNPASLTVSTLSAGVYTLAAANTCGTVTATTASIVVNDIPSGVSATPSATTVCSGSTLTLTGSATGATSYSWSGPNSFSSTTNPASVTVSTLSAGIYTVAANNICGTVTATTASVTINATPSGVSATPSSTSMCAGSTLTLTGAATGATSYSWTGPNSFSSTLLTPAGITVSTLSAGIYTLTATNSCGNTVATTASVTVISSPTVAAISPGTVTIVTGNSASLTDATSSGLWSSTNTSVAAINTSGVVTGIGAGSATISYIVTNACGSGFAVRSVSVSAPTAATIYLNNFSATTATASDAPATLDAHLTTASPGWSTSSVFTSFGGASGQALSLSNSSGTPTYTLTLNVASGYAMSITAFNFWRQRSATGAQNWSMKVNTTTVGSGTVPTTGAGIGSTAVSSAVNNLTGTVTVVLTMSGASGAGTFRLDDFLLTGTVVAQPAPIVNPDPVASSILTGSNTSFTVGATSATSYQWQRNTSGLSGGTWVNINSSSLDAGGLYSGFTTSTTASTNTLSLTGVPIGWNGYAYRCNVTNASGTSTSNGALLTVTNPSPCSGTPTAGTASAATPAYCTSGATTISTTGTTIATGLTYQWESSPDNATWSGISGATNTTYVTPTITATTYYRMGVTCSGSGLSDNTNSAVVTINPIPTITPSPATAYVCSGGSGVTLTVTGASTYTWSPSTALSATTGATINANPIASTIYTVTGTSAAGCVGTNTVSLTYNLGVTTLSVTPTSISMCPAAAPQRMLVSGGIVGPTIINSGTISATINGGSLATSTNTMAVTGIPAGAVITGAYVKLDATMAFQSDYYVNLASPDGHVLNLINRKGTSVTTPGSFTNDTISSTSTNAFPVIGTAVPANTAFQADATNGIGFSPYISNVTTWSGLMGTINGNWVIVFSNATTFTNANGTLTSWSLNLNYSYRSVTWSPTTNLFTNAAGTVAYTGGASDTVYAAPSVSPSSITYTATSTNVGCSSSANAVVTVNSTPAISGTFDLSPTSVCPGNSVSLTFTGSASGSGAGAFVSYNWSGPGSYSGTSVAATTSFSPSTSAMSGTYSVVATYANPGCTSNIITSTTPLNVASPVAYNVTGGFGCATSGVTVGLSNSDNGVNYQLYRGATPVGSSVPGSTGVPLSFGSFTTSGIYKVYADNGSCAQFMNDSATVYDTITVYNVTGGGVASGAGCTTGGLVLAQSGSQLGVSYQLYNGVSTVGSPVIGTGSTISFSGGTAITPAGTYTVSATIGSCNRAMNGGSTIYSSLNTYTVSGGTGCTSPGISVGLSNADLGVVYQLYNNTVALGSPITGAGAAIVFGTQTTLGSYTVQATAGGGCATTMTGSAIVYSTPTFTVSPATTAICAAPGTTLTVTPGSSPLTVVNEAFDGTIANDGWSSDFTSVAWAQSTGTSFSWATSSVSSTGKFYYIYDGAGVNTSSHIVSPAFSLVGMSAATLTFGSFFDLGSTETAGADVSINGGSTWTSVFTATNNWTSAGAYSMNAQTISLTPYVGNSNVKIRFRYDKASAGTAFVYAIDNMKVTGTPSAANYAWVPSSGLSATTGTSITAIPTVTTVYSVSVLGCNISGTSNVQVDALPTAGSIGVSSSAICLGTGAVLVLSEATTISGPASASLSSYSWSGPNSYVSTGTGTSVGNRSITATTTAQSGIYSLTVTYNEPGCTSLPVLSPSVTVGNTPTVAGIAGSDTALCTGGSITLTAGSVTGSFGSFVSYVWSGPGGYTNTVSSAGINTVAVSPTVTGVYSVLVNYSGTGCSGVTPATSPTVNVMAQPAITAVTPSAPFICVGSSVTLSATTTGGAGTPTYVWSGVAIPTTTVVSPVFTPTLTGISTYSLTLNYSGPGCNSTVNSANVDLRPQQWVGGTSLGLEHDWNTITNWTCGTVPVVTDDVTIGVATYAPIVAASTVADAKNLTLAAGALLTVNTSATLNIKGDLTNNGSVTGDGFLKLNNTILQTITGIGTVNNLELNNAAGASVSSLSRVTINKTLTLTSGTLATNDSVVLASSDTLASARISPILSSAAITGKVRAMQYIQGGYRRFRFLSHPFSSAISLSQLQDYIDITGPHGSDSGFTTTGSNAPSAFRYDPYTSNSTLSYDLGWKPFTSITSSVADSNKFNRYQGIRIFMRGAKNEGTGYSSYVPSATVIGMTGLVNQGNQTITLLKGGATTTLGAPIQDYNMVGNPYPSPVDLGTIAHNALVSGNIVGAAFYVWNPSIGASGMYQAIPINTVSATPYYVPAYMAFQVRADHDSAVLNFTESDKSANATSYLFKSIPESISLYVYDVNYHPWDMLCIKFNDAASDGEDKYLDATKPSGSDFNFYSLASNNKKMVIDARPYDAGKVVPLGVTSAYAQEFIIKAESVTIPAGGNVYLHDKLLQKYVLLTQGTEYKFSVTKDNATQGDNRFELSMKPAEIVHADGLHVVMTPNPAVDEVSINFTSGTPDNVNVSVLDMSGVNVYNKDLGVQSKGVVTVPLNKLAAGIYMVELTSGDQKVVKRLVKE